ncbi:polynucleotide adenylyltransferase [Kappamyces sp. JEL0829]|nr:polynucleotide adenylyltransferase [Kappamyces sp. JEL0829]
MTTKKPQHFGITPPISLKSPEPSELVATDKLVEVLTAYGQYESNEEAQQSDIDTLCVAPKHVKREDFLEVMYEMLKARPEVTKITAVPEAYVPLIGMIFSDINVRSARLTMQIDLIFARLAESSVPDELDLSDDRLLRNIDERCVRSLNGSRVTDDILRLVPNVEAFRTALRCIKVWAKARAIYSNVMGFFGGVAWAIVVARVCQMFPNATASSIVSKFFRIMHEWAWPQPVLLKLIEDGPLAVRVWNPKIYPQDKSHRMPVITPAYPSMCSTHNVTQSTQLITTAEFGRAAEIADRILLGQENWTTLFEKSDFFHKYKYYLQVCASSTSAEAQSKWSGLVESRLRQLIMKLELVENLEVAHPFIKTFERIQECRSEEEKVAAQNGKIIENSQQQEPTIAAAVENGQTDPAAAPSTKIWTTIFYIGIGASKKDPNSASGRKMDITWPVTEFQKTVKGWDQYDADLYYIHTNYLKSSNLPLDVYDDDEVAKVLKKRTKQAAKVRK